MSTIRYWIEYRKGEPIPEDMKFEDWHEFETEGNFALSSKVSKDTFTSEYNLLESDVKCVFAYQIENNYH